MAKKKTGDKPKTEAVSSTCLRTVKHDKATKDLTVEFRTSGARYRYSGVSARTANGLKNASSVGKYYNRNVRNEYEYERLSGGRRRGRVKRHR